MTELTDVRHKKLRDIVAALPLKGGKLLDIGCFDGSLTLALGEAMRANEVDGIDVVPEALAAAERKGIHTSKVNVNEDLFPYPDEHFDVVVASEIIEHCIVPEHLLREVWRVVKPGGYFLLSTPNLAAFYNRFLLLIGSQPLSVEASYEFASAGKAFGFAFGPRGTGRGVYQGDPGHIRCMTTGATKDLLRALRFRIEGIKSYSWSSTYVKRPLRLFTFAVDKFFSFIPGFTSGYIYIITREPDGQEFVGAGETGS